MAELSVLLSTLDTYPFAKGGVSTWCDILCHKLPQVDFTLYIITYRREALSQYEIPSNVKKLLYVPTTSARKSGTYIMKNLPFFQDKPRKNMPTESVIEAEFVPHLRRLLQGILKPEPGVAQYGQVIYDLWRYFHCYDWDTSWRSPIARHSFAEEAKRCYAEQPRDFSPGGVLSNFDLSTARNLIRSRLLPLNAPVPETSIVHSSNAGFIGGLPGIIAKQAYGTPFIVTEHGVFLRENYLSVTSTQLTPFGKYFLMSMAKFMCRLNYTCSDIISTTSHFNRRWEIRSGADPDKIKVVYNGVSPSVFVPKPKPPKTANRPTVVAVTKLAPIKDIETMIRSAAVARRSIPNIHYLIYGSVTVNRLYAEKCFRLAAELNLGDTLKFCGFKGRSAELYNQGDISVISSVSESCPYALLESMSCARPVASTDVGDIKKILRGFGITVPPRNPEALGQAVVKLLKEDDLRLQLGRKARQAILTKYSDSMTVDSYWRLYHRLASAKRELDVNFAV
jgi:glycosyltransferase involved in cell wall biosynthesis